LLATRGIRLHRVAPPSPAARPLLDALANPGPEAGGVELALVLALEEARGVGLTRLPATVTIRRAALFVLLLVLAAAGTLRERDDLQARLAHTEARIADVARKLRILGRPGGDAGD